ncbi:AAA family ATPase [Actinoalloteichus sp. AHMU CJ021]|uniref:UvrD-helicase domain-containing protein n=1 Tax=Actinoalloteichus sp. AHMU CJ021 TaxID=2072503 RepID=UPI000CA047B9|nr:AAA family ATPase [Actinoalloteichus sp. AHMU CJ021]
MRFFADLHIHSKYSRACSRDCDLENLAWWARRKGLHLVGTGDFTHPRWFEHLRDTLEPAEPGLFRIRPDLDRDILRRLPASCSSPVRFQLSVEISTIYKAGELTRKVHHLVYMPDFAAAEEFNRRLGRIGNLGSDGRPILGLDSRDLLEIALESGDGAYLVPAHVWTPWFAVLGSKSGFDTVDECYRDLAPHVFALETGLSSDPAMNWTVSGLDRFQLVSNSDAHSPPMLGREATVFDTELDYHAVRRAMETGDGLAGTVEFFPDEGKYHLDGHRKCGVRWTPDQTREHGGTCGVCGRPVMVGVSNRVAQLADRPAGHRPERATPFRSLVPLPEIMGELLGVGPKSKRVLGEIAELTGLYGPELAILDEVPVDELSARSTLLGEAIARLRRGEVIRDGGYDGEYGVIRLFEPGELRRDRERHTPALFDAEPTPAPVRARPGTVPGGAHAATTAGAPGVRGGASTPQPTTAAAPDGAVEGTPVAAEQSDGPLAGLDPDQLRAAGAPAGPLLIVAGPGTGKTRTLTRRIAHLCARGVPPERVLAITFTRRAAEEMAERLADLVGDAARAMAVTTFHSWGLRLLREFPQRFGLTPDFAVASEQRRLEVVGTLTGDARGARAVLGELSRLRRSGCVPTGTAAVTPGEDGAGTPPEVGAPSGEPDPELVELATRYLGVLRSHDLVDLDDLVALPTELLESDADLRSLVRARHPWVSVDEYQDVDEVQYRLLRALVPPEGNLTAIGDPDQAIYSFRGADVRFFLRFQEDFPGANTVSLTRNYRSNRHIVAGALQAIAPTTLVPGRALLPSAALPATRIGLHQAGDERAEASFVARTIDALLGGSSFHSLDSGRASGEGDEGLGFSDIAVLYRTDAQASAVVEALTVAGVPFQKRSHDRLRERPGVAELVAELRYVPPAPPGGGGPVTVLDRLRRAADRLAARVPVGERAERLVLLDTAVDLLRGLAARCGADLDRFRDELALGVEVDTLDPRADRVALLTLHAAKGLEFPVVFLVGCEDGLLPHRLPGTPPGEQDPAALAEERRLFFVGMTRAQRHLYLSSAANRFRHGASRPGVPSPFLSALDGGVYQRIGQAGPKASRPARQLRLL